MNYDILTVNKTDQIVIQEHNNPHNAITFADHRDLLLLRARINHYLDTLQADDMLDHAPPSPDEMISAIQARAEAAQRGHEVESSALNMAISRGTIPGAEKRGGRWWLPRAEFETWLAGHIHRK